MPTSQYLSPGMRPKQLTVDENVGDSPKNSKKSIKEQPDKTKAKKDEIKKQTSTTGTIKPPNWPKTPSQKPAKSPRVYLKPRAVEFKPLYTVDSGSKGSGSAAVNTSKMKLTLASLRALFGAETLPYLDQFSVKTQHTCCALVLSGIFSGMKIILFTFAIAWTAVFNSRTLGHLQKAFANLNVETESDFETKIPTTMAASLYGISSIIYSVYMFGALSIAAEIAVIVSTALRNTKPIAISLAVSFILNFWTITIMYGISLTAFDSNQIAGSFIGNLVLRDFDNYPGGHVFHTLQEDFNCCGFKGGSEDWHRNIALNWTEPGLNEPRSFNNDFKWSSNCPVEITCFVPLSCCKNEYLPKDDQTDPTEYCNRANVSRLTYDQLRSKKEDLFDAMSPKFPEQVNSYGCVPVIAKRIAKWAHGMLGTTIVIFILWALNVWLITLTFAEATGMGSIDPHTRMVDPGTLRGIVPFGALIDSKLCCGSETWPMYDDASERDAVRDDRTALMAIEEGKALKTVDLSSNNNSLGLFMPNLAELRPNTVSKRAVSKSPNKMTVKPKEK